MDFDLSQLTDLSAEKSILGAILIDNNALYQTFSMEPDDFFVASHRNIFISMRDLAMSGAKIDAFMIANYLRSSDPPVNVSVDVIASLIDGVFEARVENLVKIVHSLGLRRRFVLNCKRCADMAFDLSERTEDCIAVAHDRMLELAGDGTRKSYSIKEFSFDVYAKIRKTANTSPDLTIGLTTGIDRLDRVTTGLRPGEYWVMGSWTGSGKTALLTQTIQANASREIPVLWFTQEMTRQQVLLRLIPKLSDGVVRARDLRDPRNMTGAQLKVFDDTQAIIDRWPLFINDATSLDIVHLVAHAQMMVRREKIQLIGVDYLQLLNAQGADSRKERATAVSCGLRELAKSTGVPVLVVSQLSRPEDKKVRPPRLFDLKESGDIENDAHVVIMPFREKNRENKYTGDDLIQIEKQREGPTGSVKVQFDTSTLTFSPRGEEEEMGEMF